MKIPAISLLVVMLIVLAAFFLLGKSSQNRKTPGLVDGGLARCPARPNCVCSEFPGDADHYVEPLALPRDPEEFETDWIRAVISDMGGIVQNVDNNHVAATFSSDVFRFVDDFEVRADFENGVLHLRSASRVGYGDAGVNRRRVEAFREKYLAGPGAVAGPGG